MRSLLALLLLSACGAPQRAPAHTQPFTHGLSIGELREGSFVVWARGARPGALHVRIGEQEHVAALDPARDHTAHLAIGDLSAERVRYRAWLTADAPGPSGEPIEGEVRMPPPRDRAASVRFVFGGDVSGQNVCRDRQRGLPAVTAMASRGADFAIGLGDMVYADSPCRAVGHFGNAQHAGPPDARERAEYWAHWRYNLSDPSVQAIRRAYYAVWDDHEVVNDFAPHGVRGALGPPGGAALRDYNPFADDGPLYRSARWGRHLELFFLDTRSHRDDNAARDDAEHPKTMLGEAQREWLLDGVRRSDATWKVIVSSVPLAIPTGWPPEAPRDGWADLGGPTGFERELVAILRAIADAGIERLIVLATDVHFATVLRHRPFEDRSFEVLEVVTGPLSAGLYPSRALDETLRPERLFFHGPESMDAVQSYDEALSWLNFGEVEVEADGTLHVRVIDGLGAMRFEHTQRATIPH